MRSEELPVIACSLGAADLAERTDEFSRLFRTSLLSTQLDQGSVRLTFQPDALNNVMELVAKESACCPFFEMDVTRTEGEVVLSIGAPPEAEGLIEQIHGSATSALSDPRS